MSQRTAPPATKPRSGHAARRRLLRLGLAAGGSPAAWWSGTLTVTVAAGTAQAQGQRSASQRGEPPRLALLIGNRDYPDDDDLPSVHKNVADLRLALERWGFVVTSAVDQDLAGARGLLARFSDTVRAAPADATVFFYFAGHGVQVRSENLLLAARSSPRAPSTLIAQTSLVLSKDVIGMLPIRPEGTTMAVVDACRTQLRRLREGEGLNQVEAPPGCLIAFATGRNKPAIAPIDPNRLTFYTASLVKVLNTAHGETPFPDVFRLVKADTEATMKNHPVKVVRDLAQEPFIAENLSVRRPLAPVVPQAPPPPPRKEDESVAWARLESLVWPADVARAAAAYVADYPDSRLIGSATVARDGAQDAAQILRRNDVRLFRSAFDIGDKTPANEAADIFKAGRGDKDAAARMGQCNEPAIGLGGAGIDRTGRYEGWMQYAALLGNGIASYRLALYYRRTGQPLLASQYEGLARELGYTPPPSLDNRRS